MTDITFTRAEREGLVRKIQAWFDSELDQEIGGFDAGFLLDFFIEQIGPAFYNRALNDVEAALSSRMEDVLEAVRDLEKPVSG